MKRPLVVTDARRGEGRPGGARATTCSARRGIVHVRVRPGEAEPDREGRLRRARGLPDRRVRRHRRARRWQPARRGQAGAAADHARAPPLASYDDATGGDQFVSDDVPPLIAIPTTAGTGSRGEPLGRGDARGHRAQDGHLQPVPAAQGGHLRSRADRRPAAARDRGHRHGRLHPLPRGVPEQRLPPARGRGGHRRHPARGALASGGRFKSRRTSRARRT